MDKRFHTTGNEIDLLPIIDPNYDLKKRIEDSIDYLTIEERDLFTMRHGLLEYSSDGTRTFRFIAKKAKKHHTTVYKRYKKICIKIREVSQHLY